VRRTQDRGRHPPEEARDFQRERIWPATNRSRAPDPPPAIESFSNNNILSGLPAEEFNLLKNYLQPIRFKRGHLFYNVAAPIEFVCFPLAGIIGLFAVTHDGRTVVLAAAGREGFVGVPVLLGEQTESLRAVAVAEGTALMLDRNQLSRMLSSTPQFAAALRRYCGTYLTQVVQIGACHALHNVVQRVAMWLLMIRDRSNSDSLLLTQEALSEMLGCRRSSVSEALSLLQKAHTVHAGRGHIRIINPVRLTEHSCVCLR
jgi:CRP-like cAMP-binding protein